MQKSQQFLQLDLPKDISKCKSLAKKIGYPIMLKASWGGGGRGMRVIRKESELENQINTARKAKQCFWQR